MCFHECASYSRKSVHLKNAFIVKKKKVTMFQIHLQLHVVLSLFVAQSLFVEVDPHLCNSAVEHM